MPAKVQFTGVIIKSDSSALEWNWNFGNGSTAAGQIPVEAIFREEKNYEVQAIATNNFGCKDTMTKTVMPLPLPKVNAGEDKSIASGGNIQLHPTNTPDVVSYNWSPSEGLNCINCKEPVATPKRTTSYTIAVTNQQGCTGTDDVTISVFCNDGNLFMPNTFSPNGDGVNDIFYPRGKGLFTVKVLRVFNRWGEVVFEKHDFQPNDISKGWNGIHNGRPASQDVYVYSVDLVCENNTILNYKGNVALIR
jgi:gliding motility-associated-like protein